MRWLDTIPTTQTTRIHQTGNSHPNLTTIALLLQCPTHGPSLANTQLRIHGHYWHATHTCHKCEDHTP